MNEIMRKRDSWSVNNYVKRYDMGKINFENPIQRGKVWSKQKSSLYIHSLLYGILIDQKPFLISQKDGRWDILDGKQRSLSLIQYVKGEYALAGLQKEEEKYPIYVDGKPVSINGKRFKELPIELQMEIEDFSVEFAMIIGATPEDEALYFTRSNSGEEMSKVDMARAKAKSIEVIRELSQHDIFSVMFDKKQLEKLPQDEVIIKCYQALFTNDYDFSAKNYTNLLEDIDITDEESEQLSNIFNTMKETYLTLMMTNKSTAKQFFARTNMLAYIKYIGLFNGDNQKFTSWAEQFFGDIPAEYEVYTKAHTTSVRSVTSRMEIIKNSIDEYLA